MSYYNDYSLYLSGLNPAAQNSLYYNFAGLGRMTGTYTGPGFQQILNSKAASSSRRSFTGLSESMDAVFEEAAAKYQVDANLLKAIGKAESNFNASVVSSAGAIGVMQLMPATARGLGVSNPYDARENIMGGASYIAGLLKRYDGDVKLALAAYNAGSGNVQKYGGIPPFKETQNYVKKVMEYAGEGITAPQEAITYQNTAVKQQVQQGDKTDYWAYLIDMMRMQMDMKLAGILSFDGERDGGFY